MRLRVLQESEIDAELDAAIKQSLVACFPNNRDAFSRSRACRGTEPAFTVVIQDADNVIAHATVVDRVIKAAGERLRVAGVANVCVLPEHRGKGLSDRVLIVATQEARRQDFDCGLLFTGENIKKLYARNGWVQITGQRFIRIEDGGEIEIPAENVKMYYPLKRRNFPAGMVHLQGDKW